MSLPHLFFLPGLLEDVDVFRPVIERLGDVATSGVADLTASDSIAQLARDALRQAPDAPLNLVGHSMGGYVALEVMRIAPDRVARLALVNTHARPDSEEAKENRRRLLATAETDFDAAANALLPKLMTEEHLRDPDRTGALGAMKMAVGKEGFARQQAAIMGRIDSRPHLAAIRCPTLVIASRQDALMPVEWLEELACGIPGARLEVIEASGHVAPLEKPDEVARLLRDWLTW